MLVFILTLVVVVIVCVALYYVIFTVPDGSWGSIEVCAHCRERLSSSDKYDSNGVCPHCGYNRAGTICSSSTVVFRKIRVKPVWMFWDNSTVCEVRDDFSAEWLTLKGYKVC